MTEAPKIRYEIDLTGHRTGAEPTRAMIRRLTPDDRGDLARLILDAYIGTIDYEGETIAEAEEEVDSWLAGTPLLEFSYAAVIDDRLVSAILAMTVDDAPFIAIVVTDPAHKGTGLGRSVARESLDAMSRAGHDTVVFFITDGNTPSERLFRSLGARPSDDD